MACETPFIQSGVLPGQPSNVTLATSEFKSYSMLLADCNGNGMPAGTTIKLKTDNLKNTTASISPSTPLGSSTEPSIIQLFLTGDPVNPAKGPLVIEVTSSGVTTAFTINITP
jgi:hypothetical protein